MYVRYTSSLSHPLRMNSTTNFHSNYCLSRSVRIIWRNKMQKNRSSEKVEITQRTNVSHRGSILPDIHLQPLFCPSSLHCCPRITGLISPHNLSDGPFALFIPLLPFIFLFLSFFLGQELREQTRRVHSCRKLQLIFGRSSYPRRICCSFFIDTFR